MLPTLLGRKVEPDHTTYRFDRLSPRILTLLEPHRIQPGTWAARLEKLAPLR